MFKTFRHFVFIGCLTLPIVACKKDKSANLEIAITSDAVTHLKSEVTIQELWLNYTTKKSKSEWLKLDIQSGVYDMAHLFNNERDTIILSGQSIPDLETFLQIRMSFTAGDAKVITAASDTVAMTVSSEAISGVQLGINKNSSEPKTHLLTIKIQADSTALHNTVPVFDPKLILKSFTTE